MCLQNRLLKYSFRDRICMRNALDLYKQPGFVSELQVNYTAETACGESLSLLTGTADSARYIRGEADGRTRFEALATLSPLPDPKEGLV
mgnify:CR=1 FL=1